MKVLIIEDTRFKLEDAIEVLKRHDITDYVHFDNCAEALDFAMDENSISEIDLIILDLNFYMLRRIGGSYSLPTPNAGAKFLWQMLQNELETPVIVYSSEEDYMTVLNHYLFPSLSEYAKIFEKGPLPMTYSQIKHQYEEETASRRQKLLDLTFVIGHAHSDYELDVFVTQFLDSVNSEY